jgi:hypothetical protein
MNNSYSFYLAHYQLPKVNTFDTALSTTIYKNKMIGRTGKKPAALFLIEEIGVYNPRL